MLVCAGESAKVSTLTGANTGYKECQVGLLRLRSKHKKGQPRYQWHAHPSSSHLITSRHWFTSRHWRGPRARLRQDRTPALFRYSGDHARLMSRINPRPCWNTADRSPARAKSHAHRLEPPAWPYV